MADNYQILIKKLDEFTRKYYRNKLVKGLILFLAIILFSFLVVTGLEYFGHFGQTIRTILFYLFIGLNTGVFITYIIDPILKILKIGRIISYEQASLIIGRHFPEIQDKLLNTLQLNQVYQESGERANIELLKAGIDQKIERLRPIPFSLAVDFSKNRKFLRYALPPFLVFVLLMLIAPSFITRPTDRILHHSKVYVEEAPFRMIVLNKNLEAFQQEDFNLKIKVSGNVIPNEIFIETEGVSYKLAKESSLLFSYTFKTLQHSQKFILAAGKFKSGEYELKVFPKPTILNFDAELKYPPYLSRKPEILENTGDLIIPEGTSVTWKFYIKDVDEIRFVVDSAEKILKKTNSNVIGYTGTFFRNTKYIVSARNSFITPSDNLAFGITVIPDGWPAITVNEMKDSLLQSRTYFQGIVKDDYGLNSLTFNYALIPYGDTTHKTYKTIAIPINKTLNQQQFYYSVDASSMVTNPGDELDYYFEVCDNDGIHGSKCVRTGLYKYKAPTLDELEKQAGQSEKNITKDLENAVKESKELQKQIEEMSRKMIEKNALSWQDKKQIEDLLNKEDKLKNKVEDIRKQNEQKNSLEEQYRTPDQNLIEKQKQLNELFNNVLDEETKKMVEELKKMLDNIDKDKVNQMLDKMKMSNKDLEKELDRNLGLFKQLEFEKQLSESIEKMNELANKQEKLSDETDKKESDSKQLQEKQDALNKEFGEEKKKLDELQEKNKELEEPNAFPNTEQDKKTAEDEMNNSSQSLGKNNKKSASSSQKKASQAMKKMAEKLENMKEGMDSDQAEEDTEKLRGILQNLVRISFDQEDLLNRTKTINRNDPKYLTLIQNQNDVKEDLAMVEDSLYALAKRQTMIKSFIMKEIGMANQNIADGVKLLNDRNIQLAGAKQQYVMTSVNNLALMLSEALKQMESNMNAQSNKPGSKACKKGGAKGKMSMKSMKQMQENLNRQMQELKKEMESQSKNGKGKPTPGGQKSMSEQLARMAAEQSAIRSEMHKYLDQQNEEGGKDGGSLNDAINKMDQTEKDLINKRILQETINRQQDILTRMLESEKAELQREQEEKRQSTEAKNQKISNSFSEIEYKKVTSQSTDLLKSVQPKYNYFYKNKINSYFLKFER